MAIQLTVTLGCGLTAENAYNRISSITGTKLTMAIYLDTYVSKSAYTGGKSIARQKLYTLTPSVAAGSLNFIKQAYMYLKTLDEFTGYMDLIDWEENTEYAVGDIRCNGNIVYTCTTAGTSGTAAPTPTSGTVTDGTVVWTYKETLG